MKVNRLASTSAVLLAAVPSAGWVQGASTPSYPNWKAVAENYLCDKVEKFGRGGGTSGRWSSMVGLMRGTPSTKISCSRSSTSAVACRTNSWQCKRLQRVEFPGAALATPNRGLGAQRSGVHSTLTIRVRTSRPWCPNLDDPRSLGRPQNRFPQGR
jgi:hypothetical protein